GPPVARRLALSRRRPRVVAVASAAAGTEGSATHAARPTGARRGGAGGGSPRAVALARGPRAGERRGGLAALESGGAADGAPGGDHFRRAPRARRGRCGGADLDGRGRAEVGAGRGGSGRARHAGGGPRVPVLGH